MRKSTGYVLIAIWTVIFIFFAIQFYRVWVVNKLNLRVIKLYEKKSTVPKEFKAVTDSMSKEIDKLLTLRDKYKARHLVKPIYTKPLFLQVYLLLASIITFLWLFIGQRRRD